MEREGMSQTLTLIIAASVLMMAAVSVIAITSNAFQNVGETSQKEKDSVCRFQAKQYDPQTDDPSQVDERCVEEGEWDSEQELKRVLAEKYIPAQTQ